MSILEASDSEPDPYQINMVRIRLDPDRNTNYLDWIKCKDYSWFSVVYGASRHFTLCRIIYFSTLLSINISIRYSRLSVKG
jgi:hypothetical protein